ncbi:17 class II heat shock protein [Glycine soja]
MDIRNVGLDSTVLSILEDMLDLAEEPEKEKGKSNPSRAYVRDAKAMAAATPADVADGVRKRDKDNKDGGVKYLRMVRRIGKFMRKFTLRDNANMDKKISVISQDGVCIPSMEFMYEFDWRMTQIT